MSKKLVNGVINIPCSLDNDSFFRYWLEFLTPFHSLTTREREVAACFLKHRYLLSKAITDNEVLDKVVLSEETKRKIRKECNVTTSHFQVIMSKFKQTKFITDGKINPKLVPKDIDENEGCFRLMLNFNFNDEHIQTGS